jgi:hypothetical protein
MHGRTGSRSAIHRLFIASLWALLAGAVLHPASSHAEVVLVSQHRQLITFASVVVDGTPATGGEVFNADTTGLTEFQDDEDQAIGATTAHAEGWHISQIQPTTISMTGATGATASVDPAVPDAFAEANGATSLTVHFDVPVPTEYTLAGGLSEGGAGDVTLALTSLAEGTLWTLAPEPDGALPLSESGTLMPGMHILTFSSGGYAQAGFDGAVPFASGVIDFVMTFASAVSVPGADPANEAFTVVPNPVRFGAPVRIEIGDAVGDASVTIFDVSGRRLSRLTSSTGVVMWDGHDLRGLLLAPGVYVARIDATGATRRFAVIR